MNREPRPGASIALLLESEGPGGAEFMVIQLAEELRKRGWSVCPVVVSRAAERTWLEDEFLRREFVPERPRLHRALDGRCLLDLVRILRSRHVDVVHSHEFASAVYGAAAAALLRRPHVITLHGNHWMLDALRRRIALRWAIRRSRAAVAVSVPFRSDLERRLGLSPGRMRVVVNGIPEPQGVPMRVREELQLEPEETVILSVGRLAEIKGHIVLLRAACHLSALAPGARWRVLIAGDGPERARLQTFIDEHDLGSRVQLLGFRSDVADLLAAAAVFVMPSFSEGLPLAMLEAMFMGTAIIASDVGSMGDLLQGGKAGQLVPPGDDQALAHSLARLLRDAESRTSQGDAARARARRDFTIGRMADEYEALYGHRRL
jgi:glycosyltransferase involved in cell wall biosynthesis